MEIPYGVIGWERVKTVIVPFTVSELTYGKAALHYRRHTRSNRSSCSDVETQRLAGFRNSGDTINCCVHLFVFQYFITSGVDHVNLVVLYRILVPRKEKWWVPGDLQMCSINNSESWCGRQWWSYCDQGEKQSWHGQDGEGNRACRLSCCGLIIICCLLYIQCILLGTDALLHIWNTNGDWLHVWGLNHTPTWTILKDTPYDNLHCASWFPG